MLQGSGTTPIRARGMIGRTARQIRQTTQCKPVATNAATLQAALRLSFILAQVHTLATYS